MKKKWIGAQIVVHKIDNLKRKLAKAKETIDIDALLVWADINKRNLDLIREICIDFKVKTYLWYPILADISGFKVEQEQAVETFNGLHGYGRKGCWDKLGRGEENFLFLCPNDEQNIRQIFEQYQNKIVESGFDGVFLDRIRFPSPSNGFETLFSCFCKFCQSKFHNNYDEDLDNYRNQIKTIFERFRTININYLKTCQSFSDIIIRDSLKNFFYFRKQNIYQVLKMFADKARQMDKLVGIDLFAPSLAPLVSQDYRLFAKTCDWIKPMMYCHTSSPAGFPLELYCFLRALLDFNPALGEEQLIHSVSRLLDVNLPNRLNDLLKDGVSERIIFGEMQKIKELNLPEKVNIYVGLEAVQIPGICHINKSILKKYLESVIIEEDIKGILLSWNLLKIPDENLKFVGDFLLKRL